MTPISTTRLDVLYIMSLLLSLLLLLVLSGCTVYQVQIHNRSTNTIERLQTSSFGRWEEFPKHLIFPMTWANASNTGSSSVRYRANGNTAVIKFGPDGLQCNGCGCTTSSITTTAWKVYLRC
ncbi:hypothetical protein GEMRC1_006604 [Eukaryota sp. GEM-RC1]